MRSLFAGFAVCVISPGAPAAAQTFSSQHYELRLVTVAEGLEHPWSLAFLPDGGMLVSERAGRIRQVAPDGSLSEPLDGVPEVFRSSQGGLLDIALGPNFEGDRRIYFSYSEPGSFFSAGTAVARARLDSAGSRLTDLEVIFRQVPKSVGGHHFGSRLVFATDGRLFVTIGERGEPELAQRTTTNRGQVIRIDPDGTVPPDNPFVGQAGSRPEIWSFGHRNPQGAALHPQSGKLWIHEHGARGGDEVNIPRAGANYGWPVISYGRHYGGGRIGVGTHNEGMEQPIYYWDPSIAPSGMAFYSGDVFAKWRGNLLIGALKFRLLSRLVLNGEAVVEEERLLQDHGERIRDVRQGPDGYIYLLTDSDEGRILRLEPVKP